MIDLEPEPDYDLVDAGPQNGAAERSSASEEAEGYTPFPLDALPAALRVFVEEASLALGCDSAHLALPLLAATAGAIGNTRCILLKQSWAEPAIIWTTIIGRSGGMKSPALHAVLRPIYDLQRERIEEYREESRAWQEAMREYEDARRSRKPGAPPVRRPEGEEPHPVEYLTDDITTETISLLLRDNPRGLLSAPEEIAAFFGGMNAYKFGNVDAPRWLRMYDGRAVKVNRKTGEKSDRLIFVPRATVSLTGTVQPEILVRLASAEHHESGMMARFLFAAPPLSRPEWTEASIPTHTEEKLRALMERLFALRGLREDGREPGPGEEITSVRPEPLPLSLEAKAAWVDFYNAFRFQEDDADPRQSALWAKTLGRAARLALIHHVVREVASDGAAVTPIPVDSIEAGITLATWSLREGERVYAMLRRLARTASGEDAPRPGDEERQLAGWIRSRGGRVTPRDLARGPRRFRRKGGTEGAEVALQDLVAKGFGTWDVISPPTGGIATRVFSLTIGPSGGNGNGVHPSQDQEPPPDSLATDGEGPAP
jgi:CRISPR-associated protein Cmr3